MRVSPAITFADRTELEHARSEATDTDVGDVGARAGVHLDVRDRDARRLALRSGISRGRGRGEAQKLPVEHTQLRERPRPAGQTEGAVADIRRVIDSARALGDRELVEPASAHAPQPVARAMRWTEVNSRIFRRCSVIRRDETTLSASARVSSLVVGVRSARLAGRFARFNRYVDNSGLK